MRSLIVLVALATAAAAAPTTSSSSSANSSAYDLTAEGFTSQKWVKAFEKAQAIVASLSLQQKINFTDKNPDSRGCSAFTYGIEAAGIEGICFADGPMGINSRYSTQFPAEVTTAATWDRSLFSARASALGKEYQDSGIHVPLSIVAGPMGRSPYGGRAWENWSPDVYLTGEATKLSVEGFQKQGVSGLVKHFVGNEQEYLRIGNSAGGYSGANQSLTIDSIIDQATLRELYAWPFAEAARAGASWFMSSYNLLNGQLASENSALLNGLLKKEFNALGAVVSDWGAAFNAAPAALGGLDWVAGTSRNIWGAALGELIANGTVPANIIDDKMVRILTSYFALDQHKLPEHSFDRFVATDASEKVVRDVAEASLTLLKNTRSSNNTRGLPLHRPKDLILVGSPAGPAPWGISSNLGRIQSYTTANQYPGFISGGFGSAGAPTPGVVDPFTGITARGKKEKRRVVVDAYLSDDPTEGVSVIPGSNSTLLYLDNKLLYASSTVVFVSATAMEGYDRQTLSLENNGDSLINYVADRHNDTIVVVTAPGPVDMSKWIDHANVSAVLYAYFPTTEGGNSIASVLFGDVNPSGKLPFTIAREVADYPVAYYNGSSTINPVDNFTEGVFIDYKYFDKKEIEPLYEFGYGLSYSSFSFSGLKVSQTKKKQPALVRETNEKLFLDGKAASGLYDLAYTVQATVKNTGSVASAEVAQLYITFPSSVPRELPVRSLRGFEKPYLKAGESKTVSFKLRNKDLAYYSVEKAGWVVPKGEFTVSVGSSSRKLPLKTKFAY
ncbi:hypothetical protein JCM10213_004974 [Rhodosporidiobolus nylandii]